MSSRSTFAGKPLPDTSEWQFHPTHEGYGIYASMSDLETAIPKSGNSALQGKTGGTPANNGRCIRFRIRASVPWRASLSVPCRIGHAPARVDDSLDVIDYLREVCSYGFIKYHICCTFASQSLAFLSQLSVAGDESRFFISCCKGKQTFPDGVTTAVKLLPAALTDGDGNAGWLFLKRWCRLWEIAPDSQQLTKDTAHLACFKPVQMCITLTQHTDIQ